MKLLTANVEYSVDEIAERLDMSRRTIYRYVDTFREAGFVVKKSGKHIRLDKASPHFKDISQLVHFTEEEAVILRRAIESIDDTNLLKQNLKRKLYSVYDSRTLADTIVKGRNASNVHALIDAIENHQSVILHGYQSSHGTTNRHVEPYALTTNYIGVWCYDCDKNDNRLFVCTAPYNDPEIVISVVIEPDDEVPKDNVHGSAYACVAASYVLKEYYN